MILASARKHSSSARLCPAIQQQKPPSTPRCGTLETNLRLRVPSSPGYFSPGRQSGLGCSISLLRRVLDCLRILPPGSMDSAGEALSILSPSLSLCICMYIYIYIYICMLEQSQVRGPLADVGQGMPSQRSNNLPE